ncbi:MAG: MATE family efflux transporter, partial [Butyricicoccaceae bacterium]
IRMTQRPVRRLICELAVPTILTMLITSFYNMADTFFVGRIGTSATAAVGVVFAVMSLIQAIGFLFGQGSSIYLARKLGEQDEEAASGMASIGFFVSLIIGMGLAGLGILFVRPLAELLGATPTILPYAVDYLRIILVGAPFMLTSLCLNNQLRFQGSAVYAMIGMVSGAVLNIVLDPILIFGFDMGISGAAVATIFSQFVSLLLLLAGTTRGGNLRIRLRNFRPTVRLLTRMLQNGMPSLARQGIACIATIALNLAARPYGDAAIAAMSIVARLTMFLASALIGFGQGFQPVCSFNYGAKIYSRVREGFRFCTRTALVFTVVVGIVVFLGAEQIVALFRADDAEVIRIGALALRLECIALPTYSRNVLSNMLLQSSGLSLRATVLASARQGICFLPLIVILPMCFGLLGVQLAQPCANLLTFVLSAWMTADMLRRLPEDGQETGL